LTVSAPGRSVREIFVGCAAVFSLAFSIAAGFFLPLFFDALVAVFAFAGASASFAARAATGVSRKAQPTNSTANRMTSTSGRLGDTEYVAQPRIALFRDVDIMQSDAQRYGCAVPPRPPQA